jgi:hypothetical protein
MLHTVQKPNEDNLQKESIVRDRSRSAPRSPVAEFVETTKKMLGLTHGEQAASCEEAQPSGQEGVQEIARPTGSHLENQAIVEPVEIGTVAVRNLPGDVIASVSPVPENVAQLKGEIEKRIGTPRALQKLVNSEEGCVYNDNDKIGPGSLEVVLLKDETPLWTWDIENNPGKEYLEGEGGTLKTPNMRCDFCNVITREPMRSGVHYFEFVMHYIGDEQACGVVADPTQVGPRYGLRSLQAWAYYPGRMGSSWGDLRDGKGALHAEGRAVKEFKKLAREGDIIGMLVDLEQGAIAFALNGELQGACAIPTKTPLWVISHPDTHRDHIELRKPSLEESPPSNLDALKGSLLNIAEGVALH